MGCCCVQVGDYCRVLDRVLGESPEPATPDSKQYHLVSAGTGSGWVLGGERMKFNSDLRGIRTSHLYSGSKTGDMVHKIKYTFGC
jgi:hypothetical protein